MHPFGVIFKEILSLGEGYPPPQIDWGSNAGVDKRLKKDEKVEQEEKKKEEKKKKKKKRTKL